MISSPWIVHKRSAGSATYAPISSLAKNPGLQCGEAGQVRSRGHLDIDQARRAARSGSVYMTRLPFLMSEFVCANGLPHRVSRVGRSLRKFLDKRIYPVVDQLAHDQGGRGALDAVDPEDLSRHSV